MQGVIAQEAVERVTRPLPIIPDESSEVVSFLYMIFPFRGMDGGSETRSSVHPTRAIVLPNKIMVDFMHS